MHTAAAVVEFYVPARQMPQANRKKKPAVLRSELDMALRVEEAAFVLLNDCVATHDSGNWELARREYHDGIMLLNDALSMRRDFVARIGDATGVVAVAS